MKLLKLEPKAELIWASPRELLNVFQAASLGNKPHRARWQMLWDSVVLGQAVNIIVPLRFGEGAKATSY